MTTNIRKATAVQLVQDPSTVNVRKASAVAFVSDVGLQLRQITGYAFESPGPGLQLRQIAGYVFETPQVGVPVSKTGDLALYDLINGNRVVSTVFSASNTTLGTPTALGSPDANGHNTSIRLTAKAGSGYSGSTTFYYKRRPLSDLNPGSVSLGTIAADTTVWALLATINSKYGWNLVQQDVVNATVKAGTTVLPLIAASGSYQFVPGTTAGVGVQPALSSAVTNTQLLGFNSASGIQPGKTLALFHFDGTNGSTSMVDSSSDYTATASSGAQLSTAQSKFGGSSLSLTGTASVVAIPDDPLLRFGNYGDCTLEAWVMSTNNSQNGVVFSKEPTNASPVTEFQYLTGSWKIFFDSATAGINVASGVAVNTWMHVALVRKSGVWTLYQNGVALATFTGGTFGNNNQPFRIGNWGGLVNQFQGYIDEVRLSPVARYTANFTPPSAPFVVD